MMDRKNNIEAVLNYNKDDGTRPFKFGRPRTHHEKLFYTCDEGGPRDFVPVTVRNARKESTGHVDGVKLNM